MDFVEHLLLALHLVGMAAIIGGWLAVAAHPRIVPAMVWGARAQLVTGVLLVWVVQSTDDDLNNTKVAVKFVVALAVAACAEMALAKHRRDDSDQGQLATAAAGLALANLLVATIW